MKCPFCQSPDTQVIETRDVEDGTALRRRRRCGQCDKRFTTYERAEVSFPVVVKKDGRRADYDREKLRASFLLALRKRPVSAEAVDTAIGRVEERLLQSAARELPSTQIGAWVMEELRGLDSIAYVRFASVYHSFKDLSQFLDVLQEVQPAAGPSQGGEHPLGGQGAAATVGAGIPPAPATAKSRRGTNKPVSK